MSTTEPCQACREGIPDYLAPCVCASTTDVDVSIKAQNPDLETAWRTIAWWEQTCDYWRQRAES